jgi:hypothetical protein
LEDRAPGLTSAGLKAARSLNKAQEVSKVDILQAKIEAANASAQLRSNK